MAQTFEVNGQQSQPAPTSPKYTTTEEKPAQPAANNAGDNGIGWGSSIEVGRLARAAEDALRHGNPGAAADYAQRAVKAAPQDNKLWFLLGYTVAHGRPLSDNRSTPISMACRCRPAMPMA